MPLVSVSFSHFQPKVRFADEVHGESSLRSIQPLLVALLSGSPDSGQWVGLCQPGECLLWQCHADTGLCWFSMWEAVHLSISKAKDSQGWFQWYNRGCAFLAWQPVGFVDLPQSEPQGYKKLDPRGWASHTLMQVLALALFGLLRLCMTT